MADPATFTIQPLTPGTRGPAKALLRRVFTDEEWFDELNIALLGTRFQGFSRLLGVEGQRVWVAVAPHGAVLGVTGLYIVSGDADAVWLGWFCVAPEARGQGVGGALLDFSIEEARRSGRPFLRLVTSTDASEAAAQGLYESRGLTVVARRQPFSWIGSGVEELTRQRSLS